MAKLTDLELKVSYERLKTSVQALTLKASTEINSLKATFEIGKFPYVPFLIEPKDFVTTSSEVFFSFQKGFADSSTFEPDVVSFDLILNKTELTSVNELISVQPTKSFSDSYNASESVVLEPIKVTFDFASFEEDVVDLDFGKNLSDSALLEQNINLVFEVEKNLSSSLFATDDVDGSASTADEQTISVTKQKNNLFYSLDDNYIVLEKSLTSDLSSFSDLEFFDLQKYVLDSLELSEVESFDFVKALEETGIAEEALAIFSGKNLSDTSSVLEEIQNLLTKPLAETINSGEVLSITASKTLSDESNLSETSFVDFNKNLANIVENLEAFSIDFTRLTTDSFSVSEDSTITAEKNITDTSNLEESLIFDLAKLLSDVGTVEEQYLVAFTKDLKSSLFVTDDLDGETSILDDQEINFTKTVTNISTVSEVTNFSTVKILSDTSTADENLALDFSRPLSDSFEAFETSSYDFEKLLIDESTASEALATTFTKLSSDLGSTSDLLTLDFNKVSGDELNLISVEVKDIEKQLQSIITATDDVDGEASILDDQEVFFTKARTEVIFSTENIDSFEIEKNLTDFPTAQESIANVLEKSLFNSITVSEDLEDSFIRGITQENLSEISEELSLDFLKEIENVASLSESLNTTFEKVLDHSANADESIAFTAQKVLFDTFNSIDTIDSIAFEKDLNHVSQASDEVLSFDTVKNFSDSFFVTDDVDGEASILDDQEVFFTKAKTDISFVSENSELNIEKILEDSSLVDEDIFVLYLVGRNPEDFIDLLETASLTITQDKEDSADASDTDTITSSLNKTETPTASSSGSLISQGYTVDNTYFLEDYVGYSRLFT